MYNERKDSFSIKNVIVQFLFVALFIFLLIWLFPMKSDLKEVINNQETENLDVFYDRIFNENVIAMKDAAKSYYTNPRLSQNVGDKVSMTLGEMLEKKIILPFVDKNGETCSLTESYVEITKYDEEYVMKVNLKCSDEENYLLVYMGCYDYCSTTICEKNKSDIKTPVVYPVVKNPTPTPTVKPENPTPVTPVVTPSTPACTLKVVSGEKYGDGYTGTVVVGFATKASGSNASLTGYGLGVSANYGGNNEYSLTKAGTYTVYGYVKNSFGNTAVCSINVKIQDKELEHEYSKTTTTCSDYSDWSDWSTEYVEPTNLREVGYRKVKVTKITGYKNTTYNDTTKPIYGTKEVAIGTLTEKICTEYGYEKTGEAVAYTDWVYVGTIVDNSNRKNDDLTMYVRETRNPELCGDYCSFTTDSVYKVYKRDAISGVKYTCKNTATVTKLITANRTVITGYETYTVSEPIKETEVVTQYRYRTRTCDTKTDSKWSYYNNKNLLNAGYTYTGKTR